MQLRAVFGATLVACGSLACGEDPASGPEPVEVLVFTDWIRVEASCGYAFRAPPDMTEQAAQGIDSCVERWSTAGCEYSADYGAFSSDLSEYREAEGFERYEEVSEVIDGREAKLATVRGEALFLAAVHFPQVAAELAGIRLTMEARCEEELAQLDALSVFRTITFPR